MKKGHSSLALGAAYAVATAAALAQSPLSLLAAERPSVPEFIGVTELTLLACVPFMIQAPHSWRDFRCLALSASNMEKFAILLLIGLAGIVLYALGLGRGHPIMIATVLNLDPFWAAVIAWLVAGKEIPTTARTFALCLVVAFAGAMLLALSQADARSVSFQSLDSGSLLGAGLALPIPVLRALSGSFVTKSFPISTNRPVSWSLSSWRPSWSHPARCCSPMSGPV